MQVALSEARVPISSSPSSKRSAQPGLTGAAGQHIAHLQWVQLPLGLQKKKERSSRGEGPLLPCSPEPGEGRQEPSPATSAAVDVLHSHLCSLLPSCSWRILMFLICSPCALAESPEAQEDTSSSLSFIKPDGATFEPEIFFFHPYKSQGDKGSPVPITEIWGRDISHL